MKKLLALPLVAAFLLSLSGCAADLGANSYDQATVGQTQTVEFGTVVDAQKVEIKGDSKAGMFAGGAAGAIGGSYIGGGDTRANLLGAVGGAVVGAVVGNMIDKKLSNQVGVRYIVQLQQAMNVNQTTFTNNNNKASISTNNQQASVLSVVQGLEKDQPMIAVGTCVMVLNGGTERARVIPAANSSPCASSSSQAKK